MFIPSTWSSCQIDKIQINKLMALSQKICVTYIPLMYKIILSQMNMWNSGKTMESTL
jgi:hypothetical protein